MGGGSTFHLQELVLAMEDNVQKYHGPSLSLEKNSINIHARMLQIKNLEMPYDLLQLFSRTRFFVRLKFRPTVKQMDGGAPGGNGGMLPPALHPMWPRLIGLRIPKRSALGNQSG